jgi:hypothetical protein
MFYMTTQNLSCDAVTGITNAWYNQLCSKLNLPVGNFQLTLPVGIPASDEALWGYLNLIPPPTLKFNYWYYSQPAFFNQYAAIVDQLQVHDSSFQKDIGKAAYAKWNSYLKDLPQPPPVNTLPTVWLQWAMVHAPTVANIGRTNLSCQLLIKSALAPLAAYQGADAKQPGFSPTLASLTTTLQASPAANFSFSISDADPDISNSWAPGNDPSLFGIYTGSWCGFLINQKFAQSSITMSVSFEHFALVTVTPGDWYNSGLLNLAFASRSTPPWASATGWEAYFGANGSFNYAIGAVLAVDGISLTLTSDANFTCEEQAIIKSQAGAGYWPLYGGQLSPIITNEISFDSGIMTFKCNSESGRPILLGNHVVKINQYLGRIHDQPDKLL